MQLGEFHQLVSSSVNEGPEADEFIPGATRRAVQFIEHNWTFEYMRFYDPAFLLEAGVREYQPGYRIKEFNFWRILDLTEDANEPKFHFLTKVDPGELLTRPTGRPDYYWYLEGPPDSEDPTTIFLDAIPDAAYASELSAFVYSNWPEDNSISPWLLQNHSALVLARTLIEMGQHYRDAEIRAMALQDFALESQVAINADVARKESGRRRQARYA